ncbi:MAG: nitroreductase family deazaflavin-dependent oxidoreductase [Actinomycetota bacterium]|nr:nitroreductase family deazaflavin-dependent oxidoreductase [Actinomycetota bacterium]
MPLPKGLTRFNRSVTNKVTGPFAKRLPWFGVLRHTGRVSGRTYETPLMAWMRESSIVVALTYGPDVDWLKNARASQNSIMVMGRETLTVGRPQSIDRAEGYERVPKTIGIALAALEVDHFVAFPVLD